MMQFGKALLVNFLLVIEMSCVNIKLPGNSGADLEKNFVTFAYKRSTFPVLGEQK